MPVVHVPEALCQLLELTQQELIAAWQAHLAAHYVVGELAGPCSAHSRCCIQLSRPQLIPQNLQATQQQFACVTSQLKTCVSTICMHEWTCVCTLENARVVRGAESSAKTPHTTLAGSVDFDQAGLFDCPVCLPRCLPTANTRYMCWVLVAISTQLAQGGRHGAFSWHLMHGIVAQLYRHSCRAALLVSSRQTYLQEWLDEYLERLA